MRLLSLSLFLICCTWTNAQFYTSGSSPSRLRWSQVKNPAARVVFERGFTREATRLAHFIDSIAPRAAGTLGHIPGRVDLLLHNHSAISNGFVSWAPRRTEFFSTPHQNIGPVDWLEHLAIHEYRHVVQLDKLNQGFTRWLSVLLGQQAVGAVAGFHLPMWFLEGDAVITETTLTRGGRGRTFEFNREIKAQLVEKGKFSFDKAYLGSFRDHVPDFYRMGYLLTGIARREHGSTIWKDAIAYTGRNSWRLTPFNKITREQTGYNKRELYDKIFEELVRTWRAENEKMRFTGYRPINAPRGDDYLRYLHPVAINDTAIVASLRGPGTRSRIVKINPLTGKETTLAYIGINRETEPVTANNNLVAWTELKNHPRWENESWSIIRIHDIKTGNTRNLTKRSMFFAPSLHPYENLVAAVEATRDYRFYLTLLDAGSGKTIKRIPAPGNNFILTPSWNLTGANIVCVLQSREGKAIYTLDVNQGKWEKVAGHGCDDPRHPVMLGEYIWFTGKGITSDEIFKLNISNGHLQQVTSSAFGAMYPTIIPSTREVVYSAYTSNGFKLVKHSGGYACNANPEVTISFVEQLARDLTSQDTILAEPTRKIYYQDAKPYSEWNLFNFHSWAPLHVDFERERLHSGVSVMSQNLLGTKFLTAGINANPSARHERYRLDLSYHGFFPVIDFSARMGTSRFQRAGLFTNLADTFRLNTDQVINHSFISAGVRLPLNLSQGAFSRSVIPSARLTHQRRSPISYPKELYTMVNGVLSPSGVLSTGYLPGLDLFGMEYSLYLHNLRRGTTRDVGTRLGKALSITFRHSPWGETDRGTIAAVATRLFLPGFGRHHSIAIGYDFQAKNPWAEGNAGGHNNFAFSDIIIFPRGYDGEFGNAAHVLRSTYMMPALNPDLSIGGMAYIKRLRLNMFHDLSFNREHQAGAFGVNDVSRVSKFGSYGVEVHADTHFLRFILPFSLGYRVGIRSVDNSVFHDFILRTSFGNFLVGQTSF